ncbi:MAG: tRNA pseudouridine(38-40) synthase TruA [Polyangiaceae bacterium]|nr:tRNA pseudouridine(38-40) synthase TruA [Polyangiaceae bacterium]MCW5792312.1 tRNA pseudouridine(38-40) synthase TruA [Polyangiaceae bacterium]
MSTLKATARGLSAEPTDSSANVTDAPREGVDAARARLERRAHGVLLTVAYDGRLFHGAARQRALRTVAGELDGAVQAMDPRATLVRICSRTDRGVHARAQLVSFDTDKDISSRGWLLGLSEHLPDELAVVQVAKVDVGLHPSHVAKRKRYEYLLLTSPSRDPFLEGRAWRHYARLDLAVMQAEALDLLGEHDFAAFRGAQDERTETVRKILRAELQPSVEDPRLLRFVIEGDRFMYNMVRIIMGTLVDVGRGHLQPGAMKRALASKSRDDLGMTAPPDGLYLCEIELATEQREVWPPSHPSS